MQESLRQNQSDATTLLSRVKTLLLTVYGARLQGVLLYGSLARGEAVRSSDVDVLVLLSGPISLAQDLRTIIHALYPLQLEIGHPIHAMPVDITHFEAGAFAWFRNAKREGIRV